MTIFSLRNQTEFDKVNQRGRRLSSSYFTLVLLENICETLPQYSGTCVLGMKVSKKLGCAVIRNKIKRRIRHLVRIVHAEHRVVSTDLAIILVPKKNFEKIEFSLLRNSLSNRITTSVQMRK